MLDCTAGLSFSTQSEEEAKHALRFHDEDCKSFSDRSCPFPSSLSSKEPLKEVTFSLVLDLNDGEAEVKSVHLTSVTLSSYDESNLCPTRTTLDVYRVREGGDQLPSGCYIALFEVRTYNSQTFGEYFLTDELQLEKPLPHAKVTVDEEKIQLLNDLIQAGIQNSGHDMKYIHTLGLQVTETPAQENTEDNDCDELVGLDFN